MIHFLKTDVDFRNLDLYPPKYRMPPKFMPNYKNAKKVAPTPTPTDSLKERAIESQRLLQIISPTPTLKRPQEDDESGWIEVKRKVRKVDRELTVDEMDARERRLQALNEATDGEFNGELFDSKRHDHDRV